MKLSAVENTRVIPTGDIKGMKGGKCGNGKVKKVIRVEAEQKDGNYRGSFEGNV